jgi:hypothetical protein
VIGTPVGTHVFVRYGWRANAALGLAFYGFLFVMLLLRGPHCHRYTWFGYEGGLEARKSLVEARKMTATDTKQLPAASYPEKDIESAVVDDASEYEDDNATEKTLSRSREVLPSRDSTPPRSIDGSQISDDTLHK